MGFSSILVFCVASKIAVNDYLHTHQEQLAFVCKLVSEVRSDPGLYGSKMFPIKLAKHAFTNQLNTCSGSLVAGL